MWYLTSKHVQAKICTIGKFLYWAMSLDFISKIMWMNSCGSNVWIIDKEMDSSTYGFPFQRRRCIICNLWNITSYIFPTQDTLAFHKSLIYTGFYWCTVMQILWYIALSKPFLYIFHPFWTWNFTFCVLRIFSLASHPLLRTLCKRFLNHNYVHDNFFHGRNANEK